jgi:hypothetical protein
LSVQPSAYLIIVRPFVGGFKFHRQLVFGVRRRLYVAANLHSAIGRHQPAVRADRRFLCPTGPLKGFRISSYRPFRLDNSVAIRWISAVSFFAARDDFLPVIALHTPRTLLYLSLKTKSHITSRFLFVSVSSR